MPPKQSLGPQPLLYPEPALLIASYAEDGKPNVMTAAWGGICSSDPLSLTVSIRSAPYSHGAILVRRAFTVNIASEEMMVGMDFAGIVSGRKYDKFAATGWTAIKAEKVDAPYIDESPVVLECRLSQTVQVGVHTMFIAEILDVKADVSCLDETGIFPDVAKVKPIVFDSGSKNYYGLGKLLGRGFSCGKELIEKE